MDGASRTHEDSLAGRYRLGRVIARGGSGVVYAAHDERVGSEVAVKVLRRALASDTTAVARMVREVELVARLKHPNVVRVIDVGTEREEPFLDRTHAPRTTDPSATPPRARDTAQVLRVGLVLLAVSAAGVWWLSRASGATNPASDAPTSEPSPAEASQVPVEPSQVPAEASQVPAEASQVPVEASQVPAEPSAVTAPVPAPAIATHTDREPSDRDPRTSSRDRADPEETTPRAPRARAVTAAESATREAPRLEATAPRQAPAPTEGAAPSEAPPSRADEMFVPSWAR